MVLGKIQDQKQKCNLEWPNVDSLQGEKDAKAIQVYLGNAEHFSIVIIPQSLLFMECHYAIRSWYII